MLTRRPYLRQTKPAQRGIPNRAHRLCPVAAWLFNEGGGLPVEALFDYPSRNQVGSQSWTESPSGGRVWQNNVAGDYIDLITNNRLPKGPVTIILGYKKTDGALRAASAFVVASADGGLEYMNASIPHIDGTVYFDWAGFNPATSRVAAPGLSFGDDVWAFTVGARGMEIWQNSVLQAFDNTLHPVRTRDSQIVRLGASDFNSSDLAQYKFLYFYDRQLNEEEIRSISMQPYQWLADPVSALPSMEPLLLKMKLLVPIEWRAALIVKTKLLVPIEWQNLTLFTKLKIPIEWRQTHLRTLLATRIEWVRRILSRLKVPIEWVGENPDALPDTFKIFESTDTPITDFFAIESAIGPLEALDDSFQIFEGINGMTDTFTITPGKLKAARDNNVQMPIIKVTIE